MGPVGIIITIGFIAGVTLMLVSAIGIPVTAFQIIIGSVVMVSFFIVGAVYFFIKDRKIISAHSEDKTTGAIEYARSWGKKNLNADLELHDQGDVFVRSFPPGKEIFVGLKLFRSMSDPLYAGMPVTMVVSTRKYEVQDCHTDPSTDHLINPFFSFSAGYSGAPTPDARPDSDAAFFQGDRDMRGQNVFNMPGSDKMDNFFKRGSEKDDED